MRTSLFAALCAALTLPALAEEIRVESACYPCQVLPGTSVYFHIRVTNTDSEPLLIGNDARLRVRRADGEEYAAKWREAPTADFQPRETGLYIGDLVLLEPGESVEGVCGIDAPNGWTSDARLNEPSSNQLLFSVPFARVSNDDLQYIADTPERSRYSALAMVASERGDEDWTWVASNEVRYEILEPKGVDRQAWDFLKSFSKGPLTAHSWGSGLAAQLLAKYRWSGYTPEALIRVVGDDEPVDMESYLEQAIRRYPDAGATPDLAGRLAGKRYKKIHTEGDHDDPGKHWRGAAEALDLVLANDRLPAYLRERLTGNRDADLVAAENRKREHR